MRSSLRRSVVSGVTTALLFGCGSTASTPSTGPLDSGGDDSAIDSTVGADSGMDSGTVDACTKCSLDTGAPDSTVAPDTGVAADTGVLTDTGVSPDTSVVDTGAGDTGGATADAGSGDTGAADAGATDTGAGDTGRGDTGTIADTGAATDGASDGATDGASEAGSGGSFTVGGTISGLAAGNSVALQDNGANNTFLTTNGAFTFSAALATGASYAVTVAGQPTGQTCAVSGATGTVPMSNVSTVAVTCTNLTSCKDVLAANATAPSGAYTIIPAGQSPLSVYCDMTDNGGGWTLVLKISGLAGSGLQTFTYFQSIWTDNTTLNTGSTDLSKTEAKFLSYATVPFTQLLGMMTGTTTTHTLVIPVSDATSLLHLISTSPANTVNTGLGRSAWVNLTDPTATPQLNCNAEGINQSVGSGVRIGLLTNQETDCNSPDSATGFGIQATSNAGAYGPAAGSAAGGPYAQNGGTDVLDFGYVFVR